MADQGLIIVLSGPSGSGKGTVGKRLRETGRNLCYSISATTRSPRPGEVDGRDYFFLSPQEFHKKRAAGVFLEWAEVYGNFYGTPKDFVENMTAKGINVILEIDTAGAAQVRKKMPAGVFIFLMPPSLQELRRRMEGRGTEDKQVMETRLQAAYQEIRAAVNYDYIVINDRVDSAVDYVLSIIKAEECRVERNKRLLKSL